MAFSTGLLWETTNEQVKIDGVQTTLKKIRHFLLSSSRDIGLNGKDGQGQKLRKY